MKQKISFLQYTNRFIRSCIFTIFLSVITFLYSFICVCSIPFPVRFRNWLVIVWTRVMIAALKIICQVDYHVVGLENIPKDRNGIVLSKHQSTWETFFLAGRFPCPSFIIKRELLWVPFFGWGLGTSSPIAIDRSKKASALEQIISKGKKVLDAGRWVVIFPEGTRMAVGKVGKYRTGGTRLAVATGYPIIPVAHNAGRYWPKRKFVKVPGTIQVVIGPLIESKNRTPEDLLNEVKNWIEDTVKKIDKQSSCSAPASCSGKISHDCT